MSTEVKIQYGEVEKALSQLRSAIQSLETNIPSNIGGQNVLDIVERLNKLNSQLEETLAAYKDLLMRNEQATVDSVDMMEETDLQLSSYIRKL
ncbi:MULTISPECIES: YwqI/YxiC family protein [Bacillus]|uniref:YwqI/YxiC family protein n=1 Tax=Bacillus TaxID=1386 RepID=UPI0002EB4735|nr:MULTISPECIES: YwqI/YxiC family protein [Bacillus]